MGDVGVDVGRVRCCPVGRLTHSAVGSVTLDSVTVRAEDTSVLLDRVSWRVQPGERWVVLGPNGAGKSTLAAVVAAQRLPSSGSAHVLGAEIGKVDLRSLRTRIGYSARLLLEGLRPSVTALDAVASGRYAALETWWHEYTDVDWQRGTALLHAAGVPDPHRPLAQLSEGERQRVMLARLLMGDPELLVLDEPNAGLDFGGREALVRQLSDISRQLSEAPIVLVTHHLEEIPPTFSHCLLLREGTIVAAGPIGDVLVPATLSDCFGLQVQVEFDGRRWRGWAS